MVALKIGLDELIEKRTHDQIHKSIHGDALEALIGAIYLDRGYQKASKFVIEKMIKPHLDIEELINTEVDFKSRILEWATRNKRQVMFKVESEKRIKGKTQYQISLSIDGSEISQASGWSKKGAEQQAAESAYRKINPENLSAK
jgi:ribonuclease-3